MGNCQDYERSINKTIQDKGGLDMMTENQIPIVTSTKVASIHLPCARHVRANYVKLLNDTHEKKTTSNQTINESMIGSLYPVSPIAINIISIIICLILMLIGLLLYRRYKRKKIVRNISTKKSNKNKKN